MKPLYDHTCSQCQYIGTVFVATHGEFADLYVSCEHREAELSFILRFSSIDDDYASFPSHRLHTYLDPDYWDANGQPAKGKR